MTTREIDLRIAAALEEVSARITRSDDVRRAMGVVASNMRELSAAELRAAEPAPVANPLFNQRAPWPEQVAKEVSAPPPSLVERARIAAKRAAGYSGGDLYGELADALAAAQADSRRLDALEQAAKKVVASLSVPGWSRTMDAIGALAATMERKPK